MGTATEQVKENGKKAKVTIQTWKDFSEAKAFIEGLGLERATADECKRVDKEQPQEILVKLVRVDRGTSNREYVKSTIYKTEDGHQLTWIESAYMTADLPEPDGTVVFRFFQKFAALDTAGAEDLAGNKLVEYVNDSWDLAIRQRVKPAMVADAESAGLMKAELSIEDEIQKRTKYVLKGAPGFTEAQARAIVIASRKQTGLPVPEGE